MSELARERLRQAQVLLRIIEDNIAPRMKTPGVIGESFYQAYELSYQESRLVRAALLVLVAELVQELGTKGLWE